MNGQILPKYVFKLARLRCSSLLSNCNKYFATSAKTALNNEESEVETFEDMVFRRRGEAQRSVVVELSPASSPGDVWRECSKVGDVTALMSYTAHYFKKKREMLLVEFSDVSCVTEMMRHGARVLPSAVPVRVPFLHHVPSVHGPGQQGGGQQVQGACEQVLEADGRKHSRRLLEMPQRYIEQSPLTDAKLISELSSIKSVSEQMQCYYHHRRGTELETRLRFITCRQLELSMVGLFPHAAVLPFGSSVNGFGHSKSDLDMVMLQQWGRHTEEDDSPPTCPGLMFQSKGCLTDDMYRHVGKQYLEIMASIVQRVLPGCDRIVRIMRATVPIMKFQQLLTRQECDLSVFNSSGVRMSEVLYQYSRLDPRVAPLVFTVRQWAHCNGLTNSAPGRWITNFSFTVLVLHYLIRARVLPSLGQLRKHARPQDERWTDQQLEVTYLRDLKQAAALVVQGEQQKASLAQLLYQFFDYYSSFDYRRCEVSLTDAGTVRMKRVATAPLYIENPLECELNVSRCVTIEEVDKLRQSAQDAKLVLQAALETAPNKQTVAHSELISLLFNQKKAANVMSKNVILDLFNLEETPTESDKVVDRQPLAPVQNMPVEKEKKFTKGKDNCTLSDVANYSKMKNTDRNVGLIDKWVSKPIKTAKNPGSRKKYHKSAPHITR